MTVDDTAAGDYHIYRIVNNVPGDLQTEWEHVRHVPAGDAWHPAEDNLAGTAEYGSSSDDSAPWAMPFDPSYYSTFLFTTGDNSLWVEIEKN